MKRNVEIKAAVTDLATIRAKAANLADQGPFVLEQEEVVLSDEERPDDGFVTARRLMADLGIREDQLLDKAYIDLLQER